MALPTSHRPLRNPTALQPHVQHGILLRFTPGDPTLRIELERAPDSGGSPGSYTHVSRIGPFPKAGGFHYDILPNDNATRWYRARHVDGTGAVFGAYHAAISGVPRPLDDLQRLAQLSVASNHSRTEDIQFEGVTPTESQSRFRCRAIRSSVFNLTTGIPAADDILWNSEESDVGDLHDTGSNTQRITMPTGSDTGFWIFNAQVSVDLNGATNGGGSDLTLVDSTGATLAWHPTPDTTSTFLVFNVTAYVAAPPPGRWYKLVYTHSFTGGTPRVTVGQSYFEALHVW